MSYYMMTIELRRTVRLQLDQPRYVYGYEGILLEMDPRVTFMSSSRFIGYLHHIETWRATDGGPLPGILFSLNILLIRGFRRF